LDLLFLVNYLGSCVGMQIEFSIIIQLLQHDLLNLLPTLEGRWDELSCRRVSGLGTGSVHSQVTVYTCICVFDTVRSLEHFCHCLLPTWQISTSRTRGHSQSIILECH